MPKLNEIVDDTIAALEEMKRSGVTHVDVSSATLEELGRPGVVAAVPSGKVVSAKAAGTANSRVHVTTSFLALAIRTRT